MQNPRPCLLIVCEGDKTEPLYFTSLRNHYKLGTINIKVIGAGISQTELVDYTLSLCEKQREKAIKAKRRGGHEDPEFDQVWCVFDTESSEQHKRCLQAATKALENGLHIAISNPCFEYWYLLHFEETTRPFTNASEVEFALKRHISNYEKNRDVFEVICLNTNTAINRAKKILDQHPDSSFQFPNPSTQVYKLVEIMRSMRTY